MGRRNSCFESIKKTGYPVWSRGQTPLSGMRRVESVEANGPVALYDVQVRPGDLIAADANGIVVVPHAIAEEITSYLLKK